MDGALKVEKFGPWFYKGIFSKSFGGVDKHLSRQNHAGLQKVRNVQRPRWIWKSLTRHCWVKEYKPPKKDDPQLKLVKKKKVSKKKKAAKKKKVAKKKKKPVKKKKAAKKKKPAKKKKVAKKWVRFLTKNPTKQVFVNTTKYFTAWIQKSKYFRKPWMPP